MAGVLLAPPPKTATQNMTGSVRLGKPLVTVLLLAMLQVGGNNHLKESAKGKHGMPNP
jgi:hypothetical protein